MSSITVAQDGLLEETIMSKKTKYIVHDNFDDIEMRSKWSIEECCTNPDIVHNFKFPPPLNRYLIPKDVYFVKSNGEEITCSDVENICQKVYKKSIHVNICTKQNKALQEEENDDDDFDEDIEEEEEEDNDEDNDEDEENDEDDEIGWDDANENIDDISNKK